MNSGENKLVELVKFQWRVPDKPVSLACWAYLQQLLTAKWYLNIKKSLTWDNNSPSVLLVHDN